MGIARCAVCHDDTGAQAIYIGSRPYCTACAPVVVPTQSSDYVAWSIPTGADLKRLREWVGVTPEVCADRFGITARQLEDFERGIADPATFAAVKAGVARLFGNGY